MIVHDVRPGVHAIVHAKTNCFIIEGDGGVTLVDAGFPSTWHQVERALADRGRRPEDVRALLLTHGHFDHVGFASSLRRRYGVPVYAHPDDEHLVRHPYRYEPERPRGLYPLTHPRGWPYLAGMVGAGALRVPGVAADRALRPGAYDDLPGQPVVIHLPGHTNGSVAILLPQHQALLTGDAMVTLDPYNGRRGPRVIAPAATHDTRQAKSVLSALRPLPVDIVLPGHGGPWLSGIASAVDHAQAA